MTEEKRKAIELVKQFNECAEGFGQDNDHTDSHLYFQKKCALICVDEILKTNPNESYVSDFEFIHDDKSDYWECVKQEINKL